jgi:hypothetical protein
MGNPSLRRPYHSSALKIAFGASWVVICVLVRSAPAGTIVTGTGASATSNVIGNAQSFDGATARLLQSFIPYAGFTGGVRVAAGDVNGDGVADIITGQGDVVSTAPQVKVLSGTNGSTLQSFNAFDAGFTGGVYVAAGDVNGDGLADIVTGAGDNGNSQVKVFSGANGSLLQSFFAYSGFTGGVRVAVGDVNGDHTPDIITAPGTGGAPQVKVFDGKNLNLLNGFFAYNAAFTGGVYVAAGDLNGDGVAEIVTGAGQGGSTNVKAFNGVDLGLINSFLAFSGSDAEARVAVGDVNGDSKNDIIAAVGPGVTPQVKAFDGQTLALRQSFLAYSDAFTGGVYVAASAVPEPSSMVLAALGVLGMLCVAWCFYRSPMRVGG